MCLRTGTVMGASKARRFSRRDMLKLIGVTVGGIGSYIALDGFGYLGPEFPIRSYETSLYRMELIDEASKYGDDGDRIAYAINYLRLQADMVSKVYESWNSTSPNTKAFVGNRVPTATAAVVADELANGSTSSLASEYPNFQWAHAHTNALFTFPWITYIDTGDPRLVKMADLRFSEGPAEVGGQVLDLHYPENDPRNSAYFGKRRYIREGFEFLADNFGVLLEGMAVSDAAVIAEQSTAAAVTIMFDGVSGNLPVRAGDTFVFADTAEVPLYCYTAVDNRTAMGPSVQEGALSLGLETMKQFRDRHPRLDDGCELSLLNQGYVQLDGIFNQDPQFKQYLYQGFYGGDLSINPVEKTISWKQYETVSTIPEQTVRGFDIEKVLDYHPYFIQPISELRRDPSIVELLVESPEVYVPAHWHLGQLFERFTQKEGC